MRIPDLRRCATVLVVPSAVVLALAGCVNADPPEPRPVASVAGGASGEAEPSGAATPSGGGWAAQAETACTEVAASLTGPADDEAGVAQLSRHQDTAYLLASRLSAIPGPEADGQQLIAALHEIGSSTEELVTALKAEKVDEQARQKADAARTAAIGKAASLSAKLGLNACTPLVAGG